MKVLYNLASTKAEDVVRYVLRHHVENMAKTIADPGTIIIHLTNDEIKDIEKRLSEGLTVGRKTKLTTKDFHDIDNMYSVQRIRPSFIATKYGVSRQTIYNAIAAVKKRKSEEKKK